MEKIKTEENPEITSQVNQDLENQLIELKDKYLRLTAEFDNYRKRTVKEKSDLIKIASERTIKGLLPVLDDFERAIRVADPSESEGLTLIYNKLTSYLKTQGLKEVEVMGEPFNEDLAEAIAVVPGEETNKGKILEVSEKGYYLNEKIIRYPKVVVGG
ncbi:MAG: nucleotide exchange factor GrpE [Candidatus Peribacteria bacterium]|jgi:molecular chaperone GrpE|nr:nucleotide exchange factor GrpE [Candidatus Peribacteria bacterium]